MLRDYERWHLEDLKFSEDQKQMINEVLTNVWTVCEGLKEDIHDLEYCLALLDAYREVDNGSVV